MSKNNAEYRIIPSKENPKIGLVVFTNPQNPLKKESFYKEPHLRRQDHLEHHRTGFQSFIVYDSPSKITLKARHLFHYLECCIPMEITNSHHMGKSLVCDFPAIDGEVMNTFVNDDEFISSSMMIHFQMHIMHRLLIFCEENNIENLILYVDKDYVSEIEIYDEIVTFSEDFTYPTRKVKMMVDVAKTPASAWKQTLQLCIKELQQEMWAEQKSNQTVKEYLRINPFHNLFC